jgi:hypothetical protein
MSTTLLLRALRTGLLNMKHKINDLVLDNNYERIYDFFRVLNRLNLRDRYDFQYLMLTRLRYLYKDLHV